jgi:hypothetical protein
MPKKIDKWPPQLSADKAFNVIDKIYSSYGKTVNIDLLPEILECTRRSSYFVKRINALQSFGLVSVTKDVLNLLPLGLKIVAPVSEEEKEAAKRESINIIPILKEMIERYPGGNLPDNALLINLIRREYDIDGNSLELWSEFVKESVDALKPSWRKALTLNQETARSVDRVFETQPPNPSKEISLKEGIGMLKIPLMDDRYILIPKDLKDSEADYFNKWFEMWKVLHEQK